MKTKTYLHIVYVIYAVKVFLCHRTCWKTNPKRLSKTRFCPMEALPLLTLGILAFLLSIDYHYDQTAMNYEYLPARTYDDKGTRTIKQPPSKVVDTEVFNYEYQNGFGRGVWNEVSPLMDKYDVQIGSLGEKILLLWDDFSGHWTRTVQEYAAKINVVLMIIPPGWNCNRYGLSICNDNLETTKRARYRLWIQASSTIPTNTDVMGDKRVGMSAYRDSEKWISKDCYSS
ncbi:hypothetical protein PHMEG_00013043 [Phytophthora megakarya]|uniref:DDE-1 domain-containing protein n=1 Tax=Phytophthora megakarya TaxID=4795 RepID=A0A225W8W3_9STRA|nr:hypothetical protein PHMEG_00013043 [Phytophthora megakarya]